jgi:hypothetical protein
LKELNIYSIDITKVLTLPIMNEKEEDKWKHIKFVIKSRIFLQLIYLIRYGHHDLDYFYCFTYV